MALAGLQPGNLWSRVLATAKWRALSFAQNLVRFSLKHTWSREALNSIYARTTNSQRRWFYECFAKMYRNRATRIMPGTWSVSFAGKEVLLPLTEERIWLDWDLVTAIVGHDIEVKQTYNYILSDKSGDGIDLFVDIGANYGTHSLLFLVHGIKTITFEPNASCHKYFLEICALNHVECRLEPVALSNCDGKVRLIFPERDTWLGSIDGDTQDKILQHSSIIRQEVAQGTLDSFLTEFAGRRMLIKIDTEGNEYRVLQGAKHTLSKNRPLIIFECWKLDVRNALYDYFDENNYEIKRLPWNPKASGPSLTHSEFLDNDATNFIAVPKI